VSWQSPRRDPGRRRGSPGRARRLDPLMIATLDHQHPRRSPGSPNADTYVWPRALEVSSTPTRSTPERSCVSTRLIYLVVHHPPDPDVRLPDRRRRARDPHLRDDRHHQRFEQQREPERSLAHGTSTCRILYSDRPRHGRGQVRLMFKEIKMPPGLLLGVVHGQWARRTPGMGNVHPARSRSAGPAAWRPRRTRRSQPVTVPTDPSAAGNRRRFRACMSALSSKGQKPGGRSSRTDAPHAQRARSLTSPCRAGRRRVSERRCRVG
jgi:hypothetical protein